MCIWNRSVILLRTIYSLHFWITHSFFFSRQSHHIHIGFTRQLWQNFLVLINRLHFTLVIPKACLGIWPSDQAFLIYEIIVVRCGTVFSKSFKYFLYWEQFTVTLLLIQPGVEEWECLSLRNWQSLFTLLFGLYSSDLGIMVKIILTFNLQSLKREHPVGGASPDRRPAMLLPEVLAQHPVCLQLWEEEMEWTNIRKPNLSLTLLAPGPGLPVGLAGSCYVGPLPLHCPVQWAGKQKAGGQQWRLWPPRHRPHQ